MKIRTKLSLFCGLDDLKRVQTELAPPPVTVTGARQTGVAPALRQSLVLLMSISCGLTVANIYYCHPLLDQMARSFPGSAATVRYLPTVTQVGTMFGMFLFVPLGDLFERRRLTALVTVAVAAAMLFMAVAQSAVWLSVAGLLVGLFGIVPHLLLPFAAHLAPPAARGRIVGTLLSGLLMGILLARTASGLLGAAAGWRSVYFAGAAVMLVLAWVLWKQLPAMAPPGRLSYPGLLRSLWHLASSEGLLREAAAIGGLLFGSLSAFWATLVFRLSTTPFHYGARAAGLFGVIGAVGAAAAPLAGRIADRKGARFNIGLAIGISLFGYLVFWAAGGTLAGLILGTLLVDLGVQAGHVSNQTRIYALLPEARSRLNTVYMVSYFLGGAIGSALGAFGWSHYGWTGVCVTGLVMLLGATAVHATGIKTAQASV